MTETAFVTGGSGFIGGRLIERLTAEGWKIRALARSEGSAQKVAERGAEPVPGDLHDRDKLTAGAKGCEYAFHAAAHLGETGNLEAFWRDNVDGTRNVLDATRAAGVRRFVHVGTEAALMAGQPLIWVDERAPLRFDSKAPYSRTKAEAEAAVIGAHTSTFEPVVLRPRLVWGPGDTTILPGIRKAVEAGGFAWIGGGRHLTSTTHVDNVVEGLFLAATKGKPGNAYFVTDGEPQVFRDFITRLLATVGVTPPGRSIPDAIGRAVAEVGERLYAVLPLPGQPPVTRLAYWLSAQECTIDISKARKELGYEPVITVDRGLAQLAA